MNDIQVTPNVVEFLDAEPNVVHQMVVNIQNVGRASQTVHVQEPESKEFKLICKEKVVTLAPGLSLSGIIEYYSTSNQDCFGSLTVKVNQLICDIPLKAYGLKSELRLDGTIDFGNHINDGQTKACEISISNFGSANGQFSISYEGPSQLTFHPKTGSVKAGYSLKIKFQLLCNFIGDLCEDVFFQLDGKPTVAVKAIASIGEQRLSLLTCERKEPLKCIDFGATYYGCDVMRSCYIRNDSPVVVNYVIIIEEDSDGQEIGVDLSKKISTCLSDANTTDRGQSKHDLLSLFTAMPSQGTLAPHQEQMLDFKFSAFLPEIDKGFSTTDVKPPRRDYSIFMTVELVGTVSSDNRNNKTEIALIGSALPVKAVLTPTKVPVFDTCAVGSISKFTCKLDNLSNILPIDFAISKPAHFRITPEKGMIKPLSNITLCIEFCPKQIGTFDKPAQVNIYGSSIKSCHGKSGKLQTKKKVIKVLAMRIKGICDAGLSLKPLKKSHDTVRDCQRMPGNSSNVIIAKPDDRANSIRPSNRNETIKTQFTNAERYSYVDSDYAYTFEEEQERVKHKRKYDDYIKQLQKSKVDKKKEREHLKKDNPLDLGMIPSKGLTPPRLSKRGGQTTENGFGKDPIVKGPQPLSSKQLSAERKYAAKKRPVKGLNALPGNEKERKECQKELLPQEQYKIEIEPGILNFGDVCRKSACIKKLRICNNLSEAIHVQFRVSFTELRQTSPLSQVVPPHSVAQLEFHFESNNLGKFERSCSYTINGHHERHVIVLANVIRVGLELASSEVHLSPTANLPIESGMRSTVTLINQQNMAAEFIWSPVFNEQGTSFSMRPSKGVVDAFSSLDCEVVFYPSFSASLEGGFVLKVHGGEAKRLLCTAELGQSTCAFVERRLLFGSVPLLLATTKTALLCNTGQHHVFFNIADESPIPGMMISPLEGVVPVGGVAEIKVKYIPEIIHKFDTHMHVEIRGWRRLSLRMGGQSEAPCLDLNIPSFQFSGVYCGSISKLDFTLTNKARSRANVVFDLSRFSAFRLHVKDQESLNDDTVLQMEGVTFLSMVGMRTVNCQLEFAPSEVASYDFVIPVCVNNMAAPSPPSTAYLHSAKSSRSTNADALTSHSSSYIMDVSMPTPCRRIQGTALRPPLELSSELLSFHLPSGYQDLGIEDASGCRNAILFRNISDKKLTFELDLSSYDKDSDSLVFRFLHHTGSPYTTKDAQKSLSQAVHLDSGEVYQLSVLFTPETAGHFKWSIPILLNGIHSYPYRVITFDAVMDKPEIVCSPDRLLFEAVPLSTEISKTVVLTAHGFRKASKINAAIEDVELSDGSRQSVFAVSFVDSCTIEPCCGDFGSKDLSVLTCIISFKSPKPVSATTEAVFTDEEGTNYTLPLIATADNCLLSTSEFLTSNQADYQIIRDMNNGESIDSKHATFGEINYRRCSPSAAISQPTSATTTSFGLSVSSYEDSNNASETDSSIATDKSASRTGSASKGIEREESMEIRHLSEISKTVQRWYSSQGWAGGAQPMSIPESLRSCFAIPEDGTTSTRSGSWDRNGQRSSRSIFDVVYHLSCKSIPGIPQNITLPKSKQERALQLHTFYAILIQYLSCQSAMLSSLKPEDLLEPDSYLIWQQNCSQHSIKSDLTIQEFESFSQKAWTTLLLQVYKIFVLNRITASSFVKSNSNISIADLDSFNRDPTCSNVYSTSERVVLAWLNQRYNEQRTNTCFSALSMGGQLPLSRWIVNFDYDLMDGLVFACLLLAYVPYVAASELKALYTRPKTAEQCLHNALKVTRVIRQIGLDFDIIATDITEPNCVNLLLFCVYLYRRLPHYVPKTSVTFKCTLHDTVSQKIKLQNPSSKPLHYQVIIKGKEAKDFSTPHYNVQVPPKSDVMVPITYENRFIRRCSAVVIFVGKRLGSPVGSTLVFALDTITEKISTQASLFCESPCYTLRKVPITVTSPFDQNAFFQIVLVETISPHVTQKGDKQRKSKGSGVRTKNSKQNVCDKNNSTFKSTARKSTENIKISNAEKQLESKKIMADGDEDIRFKSFWCSMAQVKLNASDSVVVDFHFLPFSVGQRQCSILFINDAVGEFVYSIEGEGLLPLPMDVPYQSDVFTKDSDANAKITNGKSLETTVHLKCVDTKGFSKSVKLFCTNQKQEDALVMAAKQSMTAEEQQRRQLTGAMSANTVSNMLLDLVLSDKPVVGINPIKIKSVDSVTEFTLATTSKYFSVPDKVTVPNHLHDNNETFEIPVSFTPDGPGNYSTILIVKSFGDIRVVRLESTVSPNGATAELQFTCQAHQSVTQDIPVINNTESDWQIETELNAEGFRCPDNFIAKRQGTTAMPLNFSPSYEEIVNGYLKLINRTNGSTMLFSLMGHVEPPKPLGELQFSCVVNKESSWVIDIANRTTRKLLFKVFSDLPFLSGCSTIAVLPSHIGKLKVNANPLQRGIYKGAIWLVADKSVESSGMDRAEYDDTDSSDDEGYHRKPSPSSLITKQTSNYTHPRDMPSIVKPFRLWYKIAVTVDPTEPVDQLKITCCARSFKHIVIPVSNPTVNEVEYAVNLDGEQLCGESQITVLPYSEKMYSCMFSPLRAGEFEGSVLLQSDHLQELWYSINLTATQPAPTALQHLQCTLGKSCDGVIPLDNPCDEPVHMTVTCSNTLNYNIGFTEVQIAANSSIDIPFSFTPSTIHYDQCCEISFHSQKLGEVSFFVCGSGQPPTVDDEHVIETALGGSSSTILSFFNPFEWDANVVVSLQPSNSAATGTNSSDVSSFFLMMRRDDSLHVDARQHLEIPLCFSPTEMRRHECVCHVTFTPLHESTGATGERPCFTWRLSVMGIPTYSPSNDAKAVTHLECKARSRTQERIEIILDTHARVHEDYRCPTPVHLLGDSVLIPSNGLTTQENYGPFEHELLFDDHATSTVTDAIALRLLQIADRGNGSIISLMFEVIFKPRKSFRSEARLKISSSQYGVWTFPFRFTSSPPEPDDVIAIEASGLNKTACVSFRLTSKTNESVDFEAILIGGSCDCFSVTPLAGELPPEGLDGCLISIAYTPPTYGKEHHTTLLIQTHFTQWTYEIKGLPPSYIKPVPSKSIDCENENYEQSKSQKSPVKNFVRSNLNVNTTGPSSPIKLLPLVKQK